MKENKSKKTVSILILHVLCAVLVMALSVIVRSQSAFIPEELEMFRDILTDENGQLYLTDNDSYYHVRLLNNYLENGRFGDIVKEDGSQWDLHSFAPEGRSADYQPGIILTSALAQRMTGLPVKQIAYYIMAVMSAFVALAAYIIGFRISGIFGGLAAGIAVGCAPQFAERTCFGWFDTDAMIILLEVCLILVLTEAFRAKTNRRRVVMVILFAVVSLLYSFTWMPKFAILITGLTIGGGVLYVLLECVIRKRAKEAGTSLFASIKEELVTLIALAAAVCVTQLLAFGPDIINGIISALGFTNEAARGEEAVPNLFASVMELQKKPFFPEDLSRLFSGFAGEGQITILNGIGGLFVFLSALAGLAVLFWNACYKKADGIAEAKRRLCSLYCCVLLTWLAGGLVLTRYGGRFIEHFAIPVGLLAGAMTGILLEYGMRKSKQERGSIKIAGKVSPVVLGAPILLLCIAIPAVTGAAAVCRNIWPSATDADAEVMEFIRENSETDDALIISWWDLGYFYESESGHPTLWDGGSQNWMRAMLVSKAFTADDPELSKRIFVMLANSGNAALEGIMEYTDAKTAVPLLMETIEQVPEDARAHLERSLHINAEEAVKLETLIHPAEERETWIVVTYPMMDAYGWYEYYANWDFSGTQPLPKSTVSDKSPAGIYLYDSDEGREYLNNIRRKQTLWKLFFNTHTTPIFHPAFEVDDGSDFEIVFRMGE